MYPSTILPSQATAGLRSANRRDSSRSSQRYLVIIHTEDEGADPATTRGTLVDVSMGGAQVRAQNYISRGRPCTIEICGAEGRVIPNKAAARVVGTALGPRGDFLLRIEFSEPLKTIKEPGKM